MPDHDGRAAFFFQYSRAAEALLLLLLLLCLLACLLASTMYISHEESTRVTPARREAEGGQRADLTSISQGARVSIYSCMAS